MLLETNNCSTFPFICIKCSVKISMLQTIDLVELQGMAQPGFKHRFSIFVLPLITQSYFLGQAARDDLKSPGDWFSDHGYTSYLLDLPVRHCDKLS